jgi:hypothetical protein
MPEAHDHFLLDPQVVSRKVVQSKIFVNNDGQERDPSSSSATTSFGGRFFCPKAGATSVSVSWTMLMLLWDERSTMHTLYWGALCT